MKKTIGSKKMRRAKGSLGKMMEMLGPYLPQKQAIPPKSVQKWKLPEDEYGTAEQKKRNPASL